MRVWSKSSYGHRRRSLGRIVDAGPLPWPADVVRRTAVEHVAIPQAQLEPIASTELTIGQKMALLKLRKNAVAEAILERLSAMSAPEPSKDDWRYVIEARYVQRSFARGGSGVLQLSPSGLHQVGLIMRDLAPKYHIHIFTRSGGKGSGLLSQCSCGWRSTYARDSRGGQSKLNSSESWHIRLVDSGQWKPREEESAAAQARMTDFLNTVAPHRLNLSGPR
jgi:hypothetical protein